MKCDNLRAYASTIVLSCRSTLDSHQDDRLRLVFSHELKEPYILNNQLPVMVNTAEIGLIYLQAFSDGDFVGIEYF